MNVERFEPPSQGSLSPRDAACEASSLSWEVNTYLYDIRRQLTQLGNGILAAPAAAKDDTAARLLEPWVGEQLKGFQQSNPDVISLRVLTPEGAGLAPGNLQPEVKAAMDAVFNEARSSKGPAYGFVPKAAIRKRSRMASRSYGVWRMRFRIPH